MSRADRQTYSFFEPNITFGRTIPDVWRNFKESEKVQELQNAYLEYQLTLKQIGAHFTDQQKSFLENIAITKSFHLLGALNEKQQLYVNYVLLFLIVINLLAGCASPEAKANSTVEEMLPPTPITVVEIEIETETTENKNEIIIPQESAVNIQEVKITPLVVMNEFKNALVAQQVESSIIITGDVNAEYDEKYFTPIANLIAEKDFETIDDLRTYIANDAVPTYKFVKTLDKRSLNEFAKILNDQTFPSLESPDFNEGITEVDFVLYLLENEISTFNIFEYHLITKFDNESGNSFAIKFNKTTDIASRLDSVDNLILNFDEESGEFFAFVFDIETGIYSLFIHDDIKEVILNKVVIKLISNNEHDVDVLYPELNFDGVVWTATPVSTEPDAIVEEIVEQTREAGELEVTPDPETAVTSEELLFNKLVPETITAVKDLWILNGEATLNNEVAKVFYESFFRSIFENSSNRDYQEYLRNEHSVSSYEDAVEKFKTDDGRILIPVVDGVGPNIIYNSGAKGFKSAPITSYLQENPELLNKLLVEGIDVSEFGIVAHGWKDWKENTNGIRTYIDETLTGPKNMNNPGSIYNYGYKLNPEGKIIFIISSRNNGKDGVSKFWTDKIIGGENGEISEGDKLFASGVMASFIKTGEKFEDGMLQCTFPNDDDPSCEGFWDLVVPANELDEIQQIFE